MSQTTPEDDFDTVFEDRLIRAVLRGWAMFALGAASAAAALFGTPLHASGWWMLPAVLAMIFFYVAGHDFGNAATMRWIDENGWFDDDEEDGE